MGKWSLTLTQTSKSTVGPLHIPISIGLLDKSSGKEVLSTTVLDLKQDEQTFEFDVEGDVIPSLLRDFSAPIKLISEAVESGDAGALDDQEEALAFMAASDTDGFNRWESGQKLYTSLIFQVMDDKSDADDFLLGTKTWKYVKEAFGRTLKDCYTSEDYSILAYALTLPSQGALEGSVKEGNKIDPVAIHEARGRLTKNLSKEFRSELEVLYKHFTDNMDSEFKVDAKSIGSRRLRNVFLRYLCNTKEATSEEKVAAANRAKAHYESATCMTDKIAAFSVLASMSGEEAASTRDDITQRFYDEAEGDALVLDKWFAVQASADRPDIIHVAKKLRQHPDFTLKNPNRCRSVTSQFAANPSKYAFHKEDGEGYRFIGQVLKDVDPINPSVSSRLANALISYKKYEEKRGEMMKEQLEMLVKLKPISDDMFEIVSKGLN